MERAQLALGEDGLIVRTRLRLLLATLVTFVPQVYATDERARVTGLADRWVAEYKKVYPISYIFSGLPIERHDGLNINSPADIARFREFQQSLSKELKGIDPEKFAGDPEWVTWHFLNQALKQDEFTASCRNELWNVSAFGWQAGFVQVAGMQPTGSDEAHAQALTRWRQMGSWVDQEISNLKDGKRLGYVTTQASVKATIGQLDELLAGAPDKSAYMNPAERDKTPAFVADWTKVVEGTLWPALERYRNYLRDEYLPHARITPSIEALPNGRACYRGLVFSTVTADRDPVELYDVAVKKVERERALALDLGRRLYSGNATDWSSLSQLMRDDPRNDFATSEDVRAYIQATYDRAYAAAGKMVLTPPVGRVKLEPFPEFQQASAPGGQYQSAAEDGSRPAIYYYRNVPKDLKRGSMQNVIVHETLPGHHLQIALLAEHGRKGNHPITRLLSFNGPSEGWATYAEDFAREIDLYDSDFDYIGMLMSSITPMMVVDLGMQVKGWTTDQAVAYLQEAMPMRPPELAARSVATISGLPGFVLAYPLGSIEWQAMRDRAQAKLGSRFDVRAFHQVLLEDGMLPFAALNAKLDRWMAH